MLQLTNIVRVDIPVRDRDEAIAFYTETLGFSLVVDNPFGDGKRWVEVAPPRGGVTVALTEPAEVFEPGRGSRRRGVGEGKVDVNAVHAVQTEVPQVAMDQLSQIGSGFLDPREREVVVLAHLDAYS